MTPPLTEAQARAKIEEIKAAAIRVKLYAAVMSSSTPKKAAALLKIQNLIDEVLEAIEVLEP
jgi:endo-1,4-beta-D-glucanase Y